MVLQKEFEEARILFKGKMYDFNHIMSTLNSFTVEAASIEQELQCWTEAK